jgi:hypothetical protein
MLDNVVHYDHMNDGNYEYPYMLDMDEIQLFC